MRFFHSNHVFLAENWLFFQLLACFVALLLFFHFWGKKGLLTYVLLATLAANLQVLKVALVANGTLQMAQGTLVFCSVFWAFDLLVEHYGAKEAVQVLWLSFIAPVVFVAWMLLTIVLPPAPYAENLTVQQAMEVLFWPSPRLLTASLLAFFLSQGIDICVFQRLKKRFKGRFLGFRGLLSTVIGTCIDHVAFSYLAWRLLASQPLSWQLLCEAYLFTGYGLRLALTAGSPLVLYAARALTSRRSSTHKEPSASS